MADDNKPQGNEGGDNGQQTEPAKEVVSYAKYKRETDEYQEQVKALKAELEQRDKQIEEFTSKAGNAEGEHLLEVEVSFEELAQLLGEELDTQFVKDLAARKPEPK